MVPYFSLLSFTLSPCAFKSSFTNLNLCVWYLDDGTIIGDMADVFGVFKMLQSEGPALGLHLNVQKNEIWWPSRGKEDPFPLEVDRVPNDGVKLLGAAIHRQ